MNDKEAHLNKIIKDLKEKHPELKDENLVAIYKSDIPSEEQQVKQVADLLSFYHKSYDDLYQILRDGQPIM